MLTSAQAATLKAAMLGDANVIAIVGQDQKVADYYNAASATIIWRKDVKASEVTTTVVVSEFVALTAIKQAGLNFLMQPGVIDATSANVQNGFGQIFSAGATLTALTALAKRTATRFEALFASGGPPAVTTVYGKTVSDVEINQARNS